MNTTKKRYEERSIRFGFINLGDVFRYEGDYYLKIGTSGNISNAFNIHLNTPCGLHHEALVTPLNHELIVYTNE